MSERKSDCARANPFEQCVVTGSFCKDHRASRFWVSVCVRVVVILSQRGESRSPGSGALLPSGRAFLSFDSRGCAQASDEGHSPKAACSREARPRKNFVARDSLRASVTTARARPLNENSPGAL